MRTDKNMVSGLRHTLAWRAGLALVAGAALTPAVFAQDEDPGVVEEEWIDDDDFESETGEQDPYESFQWYDETNWYDDWDDAPPRNDEHGGYWFNDEEHEDVVDLREGDEDYSFMNDDYISGYYDGYYDGYGDDDFGYDYSFNYNNPSPYDAGYSEGYYDGQYDVAYGYDRDPFYYIYVVDVEGDQRSKDRQQARSDQRSRGDRMTGNRRQGQGRSQMQMQRASSDRVRGTIKSMEYIERANNDGRKHTIVRLTMEDGRRVVADFGPHMIRNRMPLSEGKRVTLEGVKTSHEGRNVLLVHSINVGGNTARLAAYPHEGGQQRMAGKTGQQQSVQQTIQNWPQASQKAARDMLSKYGQPDAVTSERLLWQNAAPWKAIVVYSRPVDHNFPTPHKDVLEQVVNYEVPAEMFDELARFDGSLIPERTRGTLASRCHTEHANTLTLNLAHDIIQGERSVEEARQFLGDAIQRLRSGETPEYAQRLMFEPRMARAGDPGQAIIEPMARAGDN